MSTFDPVRICLVGTNNFAASHRGSLRTMEAEGLAQLTCAVIRRPDVYTKEVADYQAAGVPVYFSYEEMLAAEKGRVEIVALPAAIPEHSEAAIAALEAGYNVLLEKPPAPVVQQIDAMLEAEKASGKWCVVGFQNQSKCTTRELKQLIGAGKLGTVRQINVMAEWIRDDAYYTRNAWAGQVMYHSKYCLDGPTCNALAHYLFNGLYWAHPEWGQVANPVRVRGELYHAHPIPSEDTSALQVITDTDVTVTYLTTLAGWNSRGPLSRIIGDKGTCDWRISGDAHVKYADGSAQTLVDTGAREHDEVFRNACRYLRGVDAELNCPLAMTRPYVVALNGGWESAGRPADVAPEYVTREPKGNSIFTGLNEIGTWLDRGYARGATYSEVGAPWAMATDWVDMTGYREFARNFD